MNRKSWEQEKFPSMNPSFQFRKEYDIEEIV